MQGNLVVISGPSGVGKGTICRALMEKYNDLALSVSATTRKARVGETDGKEYFFYSLEQFEELIKQEAFLEWAKVFDNYYGTPRLREKVLAEGKDCILEIDVQGHAGEKSVPRPFLFFWFRRARKSWRAGLPAGERKMRRKSRNA